jgi:hypothetical protein
MRFPILEKLDPISLVASAWSLFLLTSLVLRLTLEPWALLLAAISPKVAGLLALLAFVRALERDVKRNIRNTVAFFSSVLMTTVLLISVAK